MSAVTVLSLILFLPMLMTLGLMLRRLRKETGILETNTLICYVLYGIAWAMVILGFWPEWMFIADYIRS